MKILFFIALMHFSAIAVAQDYTLPLSKARLLFHDAIRSYVQDSIIRAKDFKIATLEHQLGKSQITLNEVTAGMQTALSLKDKNLRDEQQISKTWETRFRDSERKGKVTGLLWKIFLGAAITEGVILIAK